MKRILQIVALLCLLATPITITSAQTPEASPSAEPTAFATGLNQPATFFDGRGNPVFEITLTNIEDDWQEYDEYSAPDRGMIYVKLDFTFTNLTDRSDIISPYDIMLIDQFGMAVDQGYFSDRADIMTDDVAIAAGETIDGSVVFSIFADLQPMMVLWEPEYDLHVFIYLGDN